MAGHFEIAIVGAGAAGIAAANRIAQTHRTFVVLEALDRPGGRAWTRTGHGMALDLGCGWLHSADRNPWARLAAEQDVAIDKTPPAWGRQFEELGFSKAEQRDALAAYEAFEKRLRDDPPASDRAADALEPGNRWNAYLEAISSFLNGAMLETLSVADYLAYDDAATDANWRLPSGYGAFIADNLPTASVSLATTVTRIDHGSTPLRLETTQGPITADRVIVTVPPGPIADASLRFDPPLHAKREAAAQVPLGLADKLFLAIDRPREFTPDTSLIGSPHRAETGAYYLRPFGCAAIECFFGGAAARGLAGAGPGAAADFAAQELASLLGSDIRRRLTPLAESNWRAVPGIGGSYSHALPGHAAARAALAAPIADRLFFAGEACSATDFSTAHGAYTTGLAAAGAALASFDPANVATDRPPADAQRERQE